MSGKHLCAFVICWEALFSASKTKFNLHACWLLARFPTLWLTCMLSRNIGYIPPVLLGHSEGNKTSVTKRKRSLSSTRSQGVCDLRCPFRW